MNALFRIEGFEFHVRWTRTRFPFRYGIASMTEVPHLFVGVRLIVGRQSVRGLASEGLPPKWFTKDPATTFEQDLPVMYAVIAEAAKLAVTAGRADRTYFDWWSELRHAHDEWRAGKGLPELLGGLGTSLMERAVLDGLARGLGCPLHRLVRDGELGLDLGGVRPELRGVRWADVLPAVPISAITLRHTLGLADPLTPADIPAAERVEDGLPQDLESSIRAYGLRAFKIKLRGDPGVDLERLRAAQTILLGTTGGDFLVTLDGNENFKGFGAFREFWAHVVTDPALGELRRRVVVVEQPVHRDHALDEDARTVLEAWPDRPPLIIDESDGGWADLPRALALGYVGTSHKNCKGIVKGLANAALLAVRRRAGEPGVLTGEDLCTLGPIALLQDLASMALLGVPHVERNGHHYFRGLSPWPADWQARTVVAHPDLYGRDPSGLVRLRIDDGRLSLGSVNAAPFGVGPGFDPDRDGMDRVDLSCASIS